MGSDAAHAALNNFQQLIHLEICSEIYDRIRTLILPNLKILLIESSTLYVLKTIKLEVLSCEEMRFIRIEYPETIKWISYMNGGKHYRGLTKLRELEVLIVYLGTYGILKRISLSEFTDPPPT